MSEPTPRGVRADGERDGTYYLLKAVSTLRLTYQIRLLAFFAITSQQKLVIQVPDQCKIFPTLQQFVEQHSGNVRIEKVD